MFKYVLSLASAIFLAGSLAGSVLAEEVKGTISKVEDGGRSIMVKTKGGKEVKIGISGSRTKLDGIGSRSEFKAGQKVTAEVKGEEASMVKVSK